MLDRARGAPHRRKAARSRALVAALALFAGACTGPGTPAGDGRAGGSTPTERAATAEAGATRVLVPAEMLERMRELAARHPTLALVPYRDRRELEARIGDAHALLAWDVPPGALRGAALLRWVHLFSAGANALLEIPDVRNDPNLVVTSMKILKGPEVADHAMALLLALTRNLPRFIRNMDDERWDTRSSLPIVELRGKTMLVLGLGGIGTQLAERAHASGMRVIGTDAKDLPLTSAVAYAGRPDELLALLPEADVVAVCAPLTPETRGALDAAAFARMKDGVYFVNVSRGEIVDTDALVAALRSGKVRAAGLDVVDPEPLPRGHPLWTMENVVLTPHYGGLSDGRVERQWSLALENVDRFMRGLPLKNTIDKARGY